MSKESKKHDKKKLQRYIDELNKDSWTLGRTNPQKSYELALKAEQLSLDSGYKEGYGYCLINKGWYYINRMEYSQGHYFFSDARIIFENSENKEALLKVYAGISGLHYYLGDFTVTLEYNEKSLELAEKIGSVERQITPIMSNAIVNFDLEKYDEALELCREAERRMSQLDFYTQDMILYQTFGRVYLGLKDHEQALHYLNKALAIRIRRNSTQSLGEGKCYIAVALEQSGKYDDAEEKLLSALKDTQQYGEDPIVYFHLGNFYAHRQKYKMALKYGKKALAMSEEASRKNYCRKSCMLLSDVYGAMGHYKEAYEYLQKLHRYDKEIYTEGVEQRLETLTLKHKMEEVIRENERSKIKYAALNEANVRLQYIRTISEKLSLSLNIKDVVRNIYVSLNELMNAQVFTLAYYEKDTNILNQKIAIDNGINVHGHRISADSKTSINAWCLRNRTMLHINNWDEEIHKYLEEVSCDGESPQSLIATPLYVKKELVAVLSIQCYEKDAYSSLHIDVLNALAANMAIAIRNARQHQEIKKLNTVIQKEKKQIVSANKKILTLANHDSLTGLPNRRMFMELSNDLISSAQDTHKSVALLFIDLDNFKPINDTYGHDLGDEVLKSTASRIKSLLGGSTMVARLGGDEFVACVSDLLDIHKVNSLAEDITKSIKSPITIDTVTVQISATIGISMYPHDGKNLEELIVKADSAMYKGKRDVKGTWTHFSH